MSIFGNGVFKRKGTIESLFRFGLAQEEEPRPMPQSQLDEEVRGASSRHEVYSVRGRPFIASVPGATPCAVRELPPALAPRLASAELWRPLCCATGPEPCWTVAPPSAPGTEPLLNCGPAVCATGTVSSSRPARAVRMPASPADSSYESRRSGVAATPDTRLSLLRQGSPSRSSRTSGALINASAAKIVDEENAALFRNNLLRSCWKPGLRNEEVQHILTLWERKLVEVLHRWTHPEIWIGLKRWKRRTWKLDRLMYIIARARCYHERIAWDKWRTHGGLLSIPPKSNRNRIRLKFRLWSEATQQEKAQFFRHWARRGESRAFNTLRDAARLARLKLMAAFRLRRMGVVKAFIAWDAMACDALARRATARGAFASLAGGKLRQALNSWLGVWAEAGAHRQKVREALLEMQGKGCNAAWRCWADAARLAQLKLTAALRLRRMGVVKAFNAWDAMVSDALAQRATARGALASLAGGKLRQGLNSWLGVWAEAAAHRQKVREALLEMQGKGCNAAWRCWADAARLAQLKLTAALRLRRMGVVKAFNAWDAMVSDALAQRATARGALASLAGGKLRQGLNSWLSVWAEAAARRQKVREALLEMQGKGCNAAWRSWAGLAASIQVRRIVVLNTFRLPVT